VHGHLDHVLEACRLVTDAGVPVALHAVTDGRDVPPQSAATFVDALMQNLPDGARVATISGRYFAMDRDNRWERIEKAYDAMIRARGTPAATPAVAVAAAYEAGKTDEFIPPAVIGDYAGARDGDGFFCLNFRADRAREILRAVAQPSFTHFDVRDRPDWAALLGMVEYSVDHAEWLDAVFPKREIVNTLGAWVAKHGLRQFRLAETEKYPHVTFFLNGGKETPEAGEDRHMPPSPKVATYDLAPEMAAAEVTEAFVAAIGRGYDLIVTNYANPDMVGHTGDLDAAIRACEAVDEGLAAVTAALQETGGAMILTADHGNCETMVDPETGGPHTAHTTNRVPVALIGGPEGAGLADGRLADLAPTLLELMDLPQPEEMTGRSLIRR
jgi:2,3-bisphosphoglycerate-independent phosphoglycerate mutase